MIHTPNDDTPLPPSYQTPPCARGSGSRRRPLQAVALENIAGQTPPRVRDTIVENDTMVENFKQGSPASPAFAHLLERDLERFVHWHGSVPHFTDCCLACSISCALPIQQHTSTPALTLVWLFYYFEVFCLLPPSHIELVFGTGRRRLLHSDEDGPKRRWPLKNVTAQQKTTQ